MSDKSREDEGSDGVLQQPSESGRYAPSSGTCRAIIVDALRELDVLASDGALTIDDVEVALYRLQTMVAAIAEARGPWKHVDITSDYEAGEDERVHVREDFIVSVTLPNFVSDGAGGMRAPKDGARVSVVGLSAGLWLYRADINSWVRADLLTIDGPAPLNGAFHAGLSAMLAVKLANAWPGRPAPTPLTLRRAAEANLALMTPKGTTREAASDYF